MPRYSKKLLPPAKTSTIGIGGAAFGYMYNRQSGAQEAIDIVKEAYNAGVNYFDTSPWYSFNDGSADRPFAEALRGVDRSSFFMATKVGWYGDNKVPWDFRAELAEASVMKSLHNLQMEYIDLVQIHQPIILTAYSPSKLDMVLTETLPVLDRLRQRGLIKHIGIADFSFDVLKTLIERSPVKIDTALSWGRLTLVNEDLKNEVKWFKDRKLGLITASPLGRSCLVSSESAVPKVNHFHPELLEACKVARKMASDEKIPMERLALGHCVEEAEKCGVDVVLTGPSSLDELRANLSVYEKGLDAKERNLVNRLRSGPFGPTLNHRLCYSAKLEYLEHVNEPEERLIS